MRVLLSKKKKNGINHCSPNSQGVKKENGGSGSLRVEIHIVRVFFKPCAPNAMISMKRVGRGANKWWERKGSVCSYLIKSSTHSQENFKRQPKLPSPCSLTPSPGNNTIFRRLISISISFDFKTLRWNFPVIALHSCGLNRR